MFSPLAHVAVCEIERLGLIGQPFTCVINEEDIAVAREISARISDPSPSKRFVQGLMTCVERPFIDFHIERPQEKFLHDLQIKKEFYDLFRIEVKTHAKTIDPMKVWDSNKQPADMLITCQRYGFDLQELTLHVLRYGEDSVLGKRLQFFISRVAARVIDVDGTPVFDSMFRFMEHDLVRHD